MLGTPKTGSYEVATDQFSGPLHLLLQLIESNELQINDVSLAKVTEQYLTYVDEHEVPIEELADFLVVATRLLYLKSKQIIPVPIEDETGSENLASQLRLYKLFMTVASEVQSYYSATPRMLVREKVTLPKSDVIMYPKNVAPQDFENVFSKLLKRLKPFFTLAQTTVERVRSVKERMQDLRDAIASRARMAFSDLTSSSSSRMDVVVSFLAVLELVKQCVVKTSQGTSFEDITIEKA